MILAVRSAPIETGDDRLLDVKSIHEAMASTARPTAGLPGRFVREKARRAVAAHIGNDDPIAGRAKAGATSTKLWMS